MFFYFFNNGSDRSPTPRNKRNLPKNFGYIIQIKIKGVIKIEKEIWKEIK